MKLRCPECDRQFELQGNLQGKLLRCVCNALLSIPGGAAAAEIKVPVASAPAESAPLTFAEDTSFQVPEGMLFPNLTRLIDLSPFAPPPEEVPEIPSAEDELPSLDLPSFDEDADPSIDDALAEEAEELKQSQKIDEPEGVDGAKDVKLDDEFAMDPRVRPALEEFAKSQDPQFIVDMLYYLLEVKDTYIRPFVEKHLTNPNPVAAYLAKRIIADQDYLISPQNIKKQLLPYPRHNLLEPLFKGNEHVRMQLMESAVKSGAFGSAPYFTLRLLLERDAFVKSNMLPKLGLIASAIESPFLGRFLDEPGPKVRLACVEALACIGGDSVIPLMIKGMVDKDIGVVTAIKKSLANADSTELSQHIFDYILQNRVSEKKGYISILADYKNSIAFRALVWMFEDTEIRNFALETAKTFGIADELKADILREYLDLSYREDAFLLSVVEFMETLEPTFSRSKLSAVNAFDDSYVSLIRDSPLFVRDFAETSTGETEKKIETVIVPIAFGLLQLFKARTLAAKNKLQTLPLYIKSRGVQIQTALETSVFLMFSLLWVSVFFKGHGHAPATVPLQLFPSSLRTTTGYGALSNSEFLNLWLGNLTAGGFALLPAVMIGLILALQQIRSGNFRLRYLPMIPLLLSPILLSHLLQAGNELTAYRISGMLYAGIAGLCLSSIVYAVNLRICALVPREWFLTCVGLGADHDSAIIETYRAPLMIGILYSLVLGSAFIGGSLVLGYALEPDQSAGAWLISHLVHADGWLIAGALGVIPAMLFVIPLMLMEFFLPLHSLAPAPQHRAEVYRQDMVDLLELWGVLFQSSKPRPSKKAKA